MDMFYIVTEGMVTQVYICVKTHQMLPFLRGHSNQVVVPQKVDLTKRQKWSNNEYAIRACLLTPRFHSFFFKNLFLM